MNIDNINLQHTYKLDNGTIIYIGSSGHGTWIWEKDKAAGKLNYISSVWFFYGIAKSCPDENLDAAASLIWILTNHEAQMHEARGGKLPTMTRVWDDIASEMNAEGNAFMSDLFSTFKASMAEDAFTPPLIPEWIPFSNIIFPELQAAIVGDKTVKEALDAAAKETDYLMQDAGYY